MIDFPQTLMTAPEAADGLSVSDIMAHLRAMREAGTLSPDGARLLARAEAHDEATQGMAEVQARLEKRLAEIEEEAKEGRRRLQ